jgi:hypothetical protein
MWAFYKSQISTGEDGLARADKLFRFSIVLL